MFGRKRDEAAPYTAPTLPAGVRPPVSVPSHARAQARPPAESKALQQSTFATRAADAVTQTEPRLVSLGPSETAMRDDRGRLEIVPCEMFVNIDKRSERYVRFDGRPELHPLFSSDLRDTVTALPAARGRLARPMGSFPPADPDPPPRPVDAPSPVWS